MQILNKQNKEKLKIVFLATIGFGLLAHAFAYFNLEYSHDSLMVVSQDDNWQVSLGRFLQPLYIYFRGRINAPWLIGTLSLVFLSMAVWFMLDLFNIRKNSYIVALCGIFATNVTLICLNASYLPWVDIFMLSLLFAVVSAWITFRYRFGFLLGAIPLFVSMALYQSYLAVFVTLAMLYAIYCILDYRGMKETLRLTLHAVVCAAISAVLYKLGTVISLRAANLSLTESYNGISHVGDFSGVSILSLLRHTYTYFLKFYLVSTAYQNRISILSNLLLFIATVAIAFYQLYHHKIKRSEIIFLVIICAVFPLGANLICFITKGFVYETMTYSFYLIYLAPFFVLSQHQTESEHQNMKQNKRKPRKDVSKLVDLKEVEVRDSTHKKHWEFLVCTCCAVIILNYIVCANQAYLKKKLVYDSTQTIVTRMLGHMEATEGYIPGETPVLLIGSLQKNTVFSDNYSEFESLNSITQLSTNVSITYNGTQDPFFRYIMNTRVKILPEKDAAAIMHQEQTKKMQVFPQSGSCRMINGVMVVKLSKED